VSDEQLITRVSADELSVILGAFGTPNEATRATLAQTRLPQYYVGHETMVASARQRRRVRSA
jgi:protoporphyrinogen oxidase